MNEGVFALKKLRIDVGEGVVLVPYERHYVEQYNAWMRDDELQKLTASEPLSLEEEIAMQQRWETEDDKVCLLLAQSETLRMIGDVNLHLLDDAEAEVDVMICDSAFRRNGHASRALVALMQSGKEALQIKRFVAKIKAGNEASLRMFRKLGFIEESYSEVFEEHLLVKE